MHREGFFIAFFDVSVLFYLFGHGEFSFDKN